MKFEQYFPDRLGVPGALSWSEEEQAYTEKLRTAVVESIILTVKSLRNLADGISYRGGSVRAMKPDFRLILETESENMARLLEIEDQAMNKLAMMNPEKFQWDGLEEKDKAFWDLVITTLRLIKCLPLDLTDLAAEQVHEMMRVTEAAAWKICYLVDPIYYSKATRRIWGSLNRKVSADDFNRMYQTTEQRTEELKEKGII